MRLQAIYDIAEICFRKEIREAILCPGSRCAPLTLAFVRHPGVRTRTISDERSAAFIALGIAHQTHKPVVLVCTSGSAAYNFAPAIAEAFFQQIPLLIITADRPMEWIGQLDGQTIDQQSIYGSHVKRSFQVREDAHADNAWSINRDINEAINICEQWPRGPVHINVSIREPLYPAVDERIDFSPDVRIIEPVVTRHHLPARVTQPLIARLAESRKTLIIAGQQDLSVNLNAALHSFSSSYHLPVIGEIISNMHALPNRVVHSDVVLDASSESTRASLTPELLITFGKSLLSRNLKQFIRGNKPAEHWHIQEGVDRLRDPLQSITKTITANPEDLFSMLAKSQPGSVSRSYLEQWMSEDLKASRAVRSFFERISEGEFKFIYEVMDRMPDHVVLHLSNSMAVRYANLIGLSEKKKGIQVFANRGTSGIDGCTSTAVGHALSDHVHVLITGDMAFFYDQNAFWNNYPVANLRIILLNNHGGAIFGMIDGPQGLPEAPEYFITRQNRTATYVAEEFGFDYTTTGSVAEAIPLLDNFFRADGGTRILEFEGSSDHAQRTFLEFKEKMRRDYEA